MSKKIMTVDDDPQVLKLIELKVKNLGYEVVAVNNPKKCIETLKQEKPDLVMLDVMMPGIDGISLCSEIRQDHDVPVIMVSSLDDHATKHDAVLFGAIEYITKPINDEDLKEKIEKVLELHEKLKKKKSEKAE